jgi:hypothetical protein
MKLIALGATVALLFFGAAPAFAGTLCGDFDSDTVDDCQDNCSDKANPDQDDTDMDWCGNVCDADYDDDGTVGFSDFSAFSFAYGGFDLEKDHIEPVSGPVSFGDFSYFSFAYGSPAGPSGTTSGTTACP